MQEFVAGAGETFSAEDLKEQEALFTDEQEAVFDFEGRSEDVKRSQESLAENFGSNIKNVFKQRSVSAIRDAVKEIADDLHTDFDAAKGYRNSQKSTRHQVDKAAADKLLEYVSTKYKTRLAEIFSLLDEKSKAYWTTKTEELREELAAIVAGSEVLTEARRKELERIIITYRQISFSDNEAATIFDRGNFERRIKIGDQIIWQSDHLNIDKLARTYNTNMSQGVNERYQSIETDHRESAYSWIQNLLDEIYGNIVEYSPELSKQAKRIRIMTAQIEELEDRQKRLGMYTEQLRAMMDWKAFSEKT